MVNVYLADLRANRYSGNEMPLNIGNIAAILKQNLPDIKVHLFTDPFELQHAIDSNPPDVFMVSNYCWNKNLSLHMAKYAKEKSKRCVTVMGGPNIAVDSPRKKIFLEANPFLDFYTIYHSEFPCLTLMKELMACDFDLKKTKARPALESIAYFEEGQYVERRQTSDIRALDEIPSPFALGLLDKFFVDHQTPKMQSVRGCPYSCAYCNIGTTYYNKLMRMSVERFESDLDIVIGKMKEHHYKIKHLHLIDDNFGLLPEDLKKAEVLKIRNETSGYPDRVICYTAKNVTETVIETVKLLKGFMYFSHTSQSLNQATLDAIKRPNKGLEKFIETSKQLVRDGFSTQSEVISGLPLETKTSFLEGLDVLDHLDFTDYIIYQLTLIDGSPMDDEAYIKKHGIEIKYRPYPNSRIKIGDEVMEEYEKVVYRTSTMSEEDYYGVRLVGFLLRLQLAFGAHSFFAYLRKKHDITGPKIADLIGQKAFGSEAGNGALSLLRDFIRESREELLDSPVVVGTESDQRKNLVHKYKALILTKTYAALCDLYLTVLLELEPFRSKEERKILLAFHEFIKGTDVRSLFVGEKVPTLEEIKKRRVCTYDSEDLRMLIDAPVVSIPARKVLYTFPEEREEVIGTVLSLLAAGNDSRILASNSYDASVFKLQKAVSNESLSSELNLTRI